MTSVRPHEPAEMRSALPVLQSWSWKVPGTECCLVHPAAAAELQKAQGSAGVCWVVADFWLVAGSGLILGAPEQRAGRLVGKNLS